MQLDLNLTEFRDLRSTMCKEGFEHVMVINMSISVFSFPSLYKMVDLIVLLSSIKYMSEVIFTFWVKHTFFYVYQSNYHQIIIFDSILLSNIVLLSPNKIHLINKWQKLGKTQFIAPFPFCYDLVTAIKKLSMYIYSILCRNENFPYRYLKGF